VTRQAWPRTVLGATEAEFFGRRRVFTHRARIVAHRAAHALPGAWWAAAAFGVGVGLLVAWIAGQVGTVTVR
jgi:hypothetical protein